MKAFIASHLGDSDGRFLANKHELTVPKRLLNLSREFTQRICLQKVKSTNDSACFRSSETLPTMPEAKSKSRVKAESEEDGLLYQVP